jgi:hypothetical protein
MKRWHRKLKLKNKKQMRREENFNLLIRSVESMSRKK